MNDPTLRLAYRPRVGQATSIPRGGLSIAGGGRSRDVTHILAGSETLALLVHDRSRESSAG